MKMKRLNPYYVTGLVEGEGSFYVGILPRKLGKVDFEVKPSFSLSQHKKNRSLLFKLKDYFGCGTIRFSKRDQTYKFEVRTLKDLKEKILPHFEKFPLEGEKKKDFKILKEVVEMMDKKEHLKKEGLLKIIGLVESMTGSEKRKKFLQKVATSLKE
jgi:hypothetical protein